MLPAAEQLRLEEFHAFKVFQWMGTGAPVLMGLLFIQCRRLIAAVMGPEEGWPLILGRAVIVAGVGMVMNGMLDRIFTQAAMVQLYPRLLESHNQPMAQLYFDLIRSSLLFLPLGVLWLLMRRLKGARGDGKV